MYQLSNLLAFIPSVVNTWFIYIVIMLLLFFLYFIRAPKRESDLDKNIIVSPADGTVQYAKGRHISIFLSPLDVHVQYAPVNGYIKSTKHISGTHHMANTPESGHNEGIMVTFVSNKGEEINVTQRVGFLVRRIINKINEGEKINRSDIYGIITFGSRVDIILPDGYETKVKVGDYLYGGKSAL